MNDLTQTTGLSNRTKATQTAEYCHGAGNGLMLHACNIPTLKVTWKLKRNKNIFPVGQSKHKCSVKHNTVVLCWTVHDCHRWELPHVSFLSWQTCACHRKTHLLLQHNFCRDKHLSWQVLSLYRDETFVMTKMILVAAAASDTLQYYSLSSVLL